MLIAISNRANNEEVEALLNKFKQLNISFTINKINEKTVIITNEKNCNPEQLSLEAFYCVEKVIPLSQPYKLVSREYKKENTIIQIGDCIFNSGKLQVIAGPCAVESREQIIQTAKEVKRAGATILRGGAYKPRTSPYSFQGLGEEALSFLKEAGRITGMPVVTEIMDQAQINTTCEYIDILQVGSRNMQNYSLLKELGRIDKPILLKRGLSATIEEWLLAAEYILAEGNSKVILCERGIRTFETYTRNTLDLSAVPIIKDICHLPIIVDPSHATGKWKLVGPMAKAAVAAGADGIMLEVHPNPSEALSDGEQSLTFENFARLISQINKMNLNSNW